MVRTEKHSIGKKIAPPYPVYVKHMRRMSEGWIDAFFTTDKCEELLGNKKIHVSLAPVAHTCNSSY
jgi:hypothetical protein